MGSSPPITSWPKGSVFDVVYLIEVCHFWYPQIARNIFNVKIVKLKHFSANGNPISSSFGMFNSFTGTSVSASSYHQQDPAQLGVDTVSGVGRWGHLLVYCGSAAALAPITQQSPLESFNCDIDIFSIFTIFRKGPLSTLEAPPRASVKTIRHI